VAATFLALAFFVLPTRVHERYIFPVVALMPLLAVVQRRWAVALLLLSVGAFINLHAILTLPLYGSANVETLPLGEWFRSGPLIVTSALLQTTVGLWVAWQLRPSLRTSPDGFDREAREPAVAPNTPNTPNTPMAAPAVPLVPPSQPGAHPTYPAPATDDEWRPGPGLADRVVSRLSWGSLRRDRSASLASEPGGRVDRRDLLILIVLVIFTLTIRGFRLDQPVRMYFDEVYHARTATEFLQHWEYGQAHDIYEFTHPHLAKYAMAWGIRLAGGNAVNGTADLGTPVDDAELEQRWSPSGADDERNGDRLYVAGGDGLHIYDLATRQPVDDLPVGVTALAIDQNDHRLFFADAAGALFRLDLTVFDDRRHGREHDGAPSIEAFSSGPGAQVDQLLVTDTSVVAITAGSIATFDTETGLPSRNDSRWLWPMRSSCHGLIGWWWTRGKWSMVRLLRR
jgi:hypothetical protein